MADTDHCEGAEVEKERESCGIGRGDDGRNYSELKCIYQAEKEAPLLTQTTREKWGNRIR